MLTFLFAYPILCLIFSLFTYLQLSSMNKIVFKRSNEFYKTKLVCKFIRICHNLKPNSIIKTAVFSYQLRDPAGSF